MPSWVRRPEMRSDVAGTQRQNDWVGNSLVFDGLRPGSAISLSFPIRETTASYTLNANTDKAQVYTCTFRGSTLVDISPRHESPTTYQIYRRAALRNPIVPTRKVERFIADVGVTEW